MTVHQIAILIIIAGMLVLFVWDRVRYDLVAVLALLAAVFAGVIPGDKAFAGFGNPVLPLIAGALAVSAAIGNTGVIEAVVRRIAPRLRSPDMRVGLLVALVTILSAFMKNIGALAIFLPVAVQLARHNDRPASELLMPLSFGSLLGGSMTLIGTSPNLLISSQRAELTGAPFAMFDFTPVAAGTALCGVVFLTFGWRLLPRRRQGRRSAEELFTTERYTSEVAVPAESPMVGRHLGEFTALGEGDVAVTALLRDGARRVRPDRHSTLRAGDVLIVESDPHRLAAIIAEAKLELVGSKELPPPSRSEEGGADQRLGEIPPVGTIEAVIGGGSPLIGMSPTQMQLRRRYGVNLLAVSRRGRRTTTRLRQMKLQNGDLVVLEGKLEEMPEALSRLGCLPLAERNLRLGRPRQVIVPFLVLAAAMLAASTDIVPAAAAFVAATALLALLQVLTLKEIYEAIEWPIIVLLGALIPVGEAVRETGLTELIAGGISGAAAGLPSWAVVALVMVATMLATPVLHHAAAVIVMGPLAASLATRLGFHIEPFLMAVAIGAGSDFLSPIGHQCNTLVLGPGGYRFGDYWRLGLPLSFIVVFVGVPLILLVWPLR